MTISTNALILVFYVIALALTLYVLIASRLRQWLAWAVLIILLIAIFNQVK